MKTSYRILTLALAGLAFASCVDLNTEPYGSTVTSEQKEQVIADNPERVGAGVNGIAALFSVYQNANPGYTRHNDFGYGAVMLFMDTRGTDLIGDDTGYNWFSYGLDMITDRTSSSLITENIWNTMYHQIFAANALAGSLSADTDDSTQQFYLAQAYAVRAFDYFVLAQLYQFTYKGHESAPCVPIITDKNSEQVAIDGGLARATVQQVYDQILSDIDTAVDLLGKSSEVRSDKRYVDLATALGIRARVKLVMQDWSGAGADAQAAIAASSSTPISWDEAAKPGFQKMTEKNWMWGIAIAETDRVVTSGIVNWHSHMGSLNYGYASVGAWRYVSHSLYDQIQSSDARKGWFLDANGVSENLTAEQQDYVKSKSIPPYTQVKFAPYKDELYTSTNANDIVLMRIEEMYLIAAEAKIMSGDIAGGVADLNSFVTTYRDPDYACYATTAKAAQNAVWLQRRIEFWGEGLSYFDIMRRGEGYDRRGAGFASKFVFVLSGDDPIFIFELPESEIQANAFISESDNNPAATTPSPVSE
ncbi:MAG: RagB/SusD family nutrient uptake outer membrane protein [Bacteroidales bacterium]|nr:RagB/SusD family nutrient uptake outer membrane protein [Bacteroidales bacterium]